MRTKWILSVVGLIGWFGIMSLMAEGEMKNGYRKLMTIDHGLVAGELRNFPVLVDMATPELADTTHGGHVIGKAGDDFRFVADDDRTVLAHEIEYYAPEKGELKAWVLVPRLTAGQDTTFWLEYGRKNVKPADSPSKGVWDEGYQLVLHLNNPMQLGRNARQAEPVGQVSPGVSAASAGRIDGAANFDGATGGLRIEPADNFNPKQELTVEAWVHGADSGAEAGWPIVSKWAWHSNLTAFAAYDAGQASGLDAKGFLGAVFDGRYVYFSPQANTTLRPNKTRRHGIVLRYDTQGKFKDSAAWQAYDAGNTDGLNTKGYYGAAFDGRYVYFVPRYSGDDYHSRVLRYDTHGAFDASSSWAAYDAGIPQSFQSAAFDGRYVYFAAGPGHAQKRIEMLRYDTRGGFKDQTSWVSVNTPDMAPGMKIKDYDGAVFDGRYVYFVPLHHGVPLRYDTTRPFNEPSSWTAFDATPLNMQMCVGGVFDGRYIYYVPYSHHMAIRYDTRADFTQASSWQTFDAKTVKGLGMFGWDGAFFDGKYVYFIPYWQKGVGQYGRDAETFHGWMLRYDAAQPFDKAESWTAVDAGHTDGLDSRGFNGGAFDGRYLYLAAWDKGEGEGHNIKGHGVMLRYDTTGQESAYYLKYAECGHNGGLTAALPGPTFVVNTVNGAVGVRANRLLDPGWHHMAGVYDGRTIKLYLDGQLAGEREGHGEMIVNRTPLAIGRVPDGVSAFRGMLDEVRISDRARAADWLRTQYNNQNAPRAFCRCGAEEAGQ